jgi:hypothetical protein
MISRYWSEKERLELIAKMSHKIESDLFMLQVGQEVDLQKVWDLSKKIGMVSKYGNVLLQKKRSYILEGMEE